MKKSFSSDLPPLYKLDSFSLKATNNSFYIEQFKPHLAKHKFVSRPHNHDFYLLLYVTSGGGTHNIDFRNYSVKPGSFFLMTPGQVHSWRLEPDTDGYIIFFLREFYQMNLNCNNLIEFPFFHTLNANPLIQLPSELHAIDFIVTEMHEEFRKSDRAIDLRILRSYLDLLLLKLARYYPKDGQERFANASTQKLRKLEQLIDQYYIELKKPNEYADLLHISPSYLNSICKKHVGQTLTNLISDRLILEAKRLFAHSDLTVSQVSEQLKFSSASYFIRFFKKHVGENPEQFKQTLNRAI
ncbi:helix-turn-helix domain-containing protein [Fulvivirga sp. M361]|uniref:AraC family transcriptional regulator n=1 Tax=Fulvivirga sp. M361 TaxID=2594266 RepID=UPI00117BC2E4|nr:AraC family transcriptional regulator [Fulvivirga sp. M361]TRX60470.1 helix-turn-helix domain-containing protein [Fulvivirga sp. M361]